MGQRISPAEAHSHFSPAHRDLSDGAAAPPSAHLAIAPIAGARKLSRRQVRAQVRVGQRFSDADGGCWRVVNVHRKDGMVALQGPHARPAFVSFASLAKEYRLLDAPTRGP